MAFRAKMLSIFEVVLRVPPLFIMDELLKIGMGLDASSPALIVSGTSLPSMVNGTGYTTSDPATYDSQSYKLFIYALAKFILASAGIEAIRT